MYLFLKLGFFWEIFQVSQMPGRKCDKYIKIIVLVSQSSSYIEPNLSQQSQMKLY